MRVTEITPTKYELALLEEDREYFEGLTKELSLPSVEEFLNAILSVGIVYWEQA